MKPILGYEGFYLISKRGQIFRCCKKGLRLKSQNLDKNGYCVVSLYRPGYKPKIAKVHRLICQAYDLNHRDELQVNHKNGIKNDNRISNLEMVTGKENVRHAHVLNLIRIRYGESVGNSVLKNKDVIFIKKLFRVGYNQREISRITNVDYRTVHSIVRNKTWSTVV